jgi:predicted aconitase with swiveling domain
VATGTPAPTYQWQRNGINLSGATGASYSLYDVTSNDVATYTVVVSNAAGSVTSNGAALTLNSGTSSSTSSSSSTNVAPTIATQPASQTAIPGATVTFTVAATGTPAPAYQWRKNGINLSGATGASYSLYDVTSNDVATYTVVVSNAAGSVTSNGAVLTLNSGSSSSSGSTNVAPTITTQPTSQTAIPGATVTFTVAATGTPAPTYQWRKNGINLSGATGASCVLYDVTSNDVATYTVVVSNAAGSVTSSGAVLTLNSGSSGSSGSTNVAPTITNQPKSQTATTGSTVTFTVAATGTPAPTYQWRKNGINLSGATGASCVLYDVTSNDVATYTVVVSNAAGSVTSSGAVLAVH